MNSGPARPDIAGRGLLRVVPPTELARQDRETANSAVQQDDEALTSALASHIRAKMTEMRNFRNTEGIGQRLIEALRTYKGKYDASKLNEIKKFGGSEVYARITFAKCRGATALLRDIFLGPDRPWELEPTPTPTIPGDVASSIQQLVGTEVQTLQMAGQQVPEEAVRDRVAMLTTGAEKAAMKQAKDDAVRSSDKLDDILTEGRFYEAFAEFLIDLPIFPYAAIKGPVVRKVQQLKWVNGTPQMESVPRMFWDRVSPFDLYFTPGASGPHEAEFVERIRLSRSDLLAVKGLPGYKTEEIDQVLSRFADHGFREWWDVTDSERANLEDRERWPRTTSGLIDTAEFHGSVQGSTLLEWGMDTATITDPLQEYRVTAWLIDRFVIKTQINPSPRQRHPYYMASFETVPGAMVGIGLPDVLEDVQSVANATLRSLVNNLSISSGPQVVINDKVMAAGETDDMFPWKRWHVKYDPMITGSSAKPIDFFQPLSNAGELLTIYEKFSQLADDISAIPRYMTGNEKVGGAGRTASGLAMLMGNAAKSLQNVAATIDRRVIMPLLEDLYDMIMLTNAGLFRGDEMIVVKGVNFAVKREQDRMRQLEFLQLTANPIDMQIIGPIGRANVLRSVAGNLGLDHERVVPSDDEIQQQMMAAMMVGPPPGAGPGGGSGKGPPAPGGTTTNPNQTPSPQAARAGPEAVRRETGVEGQFAGNGRAGGGTPSGKPQ
jgi:hypothetical protein